MPFIEVNDLTIYYNFTVEARICCTSRGSGGDLRQTAPQLNGLNRDFLGLHYDQRCLGQTTLGDLVERLVLNCTSPGGELASYPLDELVDLPPQVALGDAPLSYGISGRADSILRDWLTRASLAVTCRTLVSLCGTAGHALPVAVLGFAVLFGFVLGVLVLRGVSVATG